MQAVASAASTPPTAPTTPTWTTKALSGEGSHAGRDVVHDKTCEQLAAGRRIGRARPLIERVAVERKMSAQIKNHGGRIYYEAEDGESIVSLADFYQERLGCAHAPGTAEHDASRASVAICRAKSRVRRSSCCAQGESDVAATARWEGSAAGVVDSHIGGQCSAGQPWHCTGMVWNATLLAVRGQRRTHNCAATSWGRVPGTHGDNLLPLILALPPLVDGLLWDVPWPAGLGHGSYPPPILRVGGFTYWGAGGRHWRPEHAQQYRAYMESGRSSSCRAWPPRRPPSGWPS